MSEWALENPKAITTAFTGIVLFVIQKYVFDLSPEVEGYVNIILPSLFLMLLGRYTRISKSEAELLNEINKEDSRDQA